MGCCLYLRSTMIRRSLLSFILLASLCTFGYAQSRPAITLTPNGCQGLRVFISDYRAADEGLAVVEVLFDSEGLFTDEKLVSFNVAFDGPEPPDYYGNTTDSFKITVVDPTQPAYLAIYAANHLGAS